jgi:large subunit ribosomal protein L9
MKVLLKADVRSLGRAGDVVSVADGYARNYLIPENLAVKATPRTLRMSEGLKAQASARQEELEQGYQAILDRLEGVVCQLTAAADENGHLYGSITERDILTALETQGFEDLDRRSVVLESHIKSTGEFMVPIRLSPELSVEVRVVVVPEEG